MKIFKYYRSIENCSLWLGLLGAVFCFGVVATGTIAVGAEPASRRDADRDGWFDGAANQRVSLRLTAIESSKSGDFSVKVDEVQFPHSAAGDGETVRLEASAKQEFDWTVARRALGTWRVGAKTSELTWKTSVLVTRSDSENHQKSSGKGTVTWGNRAEKQTITVTLADGNEVRLDFQIDIKTFSDPEPKNRDGDRDRDGIFDWEEAVYAQHGVGLGDPERRDLILVVGYTHPVWKMTDLTRTLLRTKFYGRGIDLYLVTTPKEGLGLATPGLMKLGDKAFSREHAIHINQARRLRKICLKSPMAENAHLVVLANFVAPKSRNSWGWAEMPGRTLVIRSALPMLGPDFHQYQAKDLMHELGHNLGLAHPIESDERCISGPIPKAERTSSASVMGTPKSDRGNLMAVIRNALARPLDYSPTQWKNVRLDWVRKKRKK